MKISARIRAMNERMNDSERNCAISIALDEPPNFFIPTSFARLDACAVERFMKLIAAIKYNKQCNASENYQKLWIACRFKFLLNTCIKMYLFQVLEEKSVFVSLLFKILR